MAAPQDIIDIVCGVVAGFVVDAYGLNNAPVVALDQRLIADLGLDSLDSHEIGLALEEKFRVHLDSAYCETVRDLCNCVVAGRRGWRDFPEDAA